MQQPSKQQVMLHLLEDAWVYVHLDPRRDGVVLPDHLRHEKRLALQYGYNMPVPIDNFRIDDRGIAATLSFRRVSHTTFIPWHAVFAVTDGEKRTMVWQEDLPADLEMSAEEASPPPPPVKKARALQSLPPESDGPGPGAAEEALPEGVVPLRRAPPRSVPPAQAEAPAEAAAAPEAVAAAPSAPSPSKPGKKPRPSYLKLVE